MLVAFDLDGCLSDIDALGLELIRESKLELRPSLETIYYSSREPRMEARQFLHVLDTPLVVTARPKRLQELTEQWLRKHFDGWSVLFTEDYCGVPETDLWEQGMDPQRISEQVAEAKAEVLKRVGASIYFEDSPAIVSELRRLVPEIPVIQFGGRLLL